ncbi:hypothetical protein AN958_11081 [Leucoagaricus sp. SymC.cos]|nr:hypothetical protein AN958_11081 [Leucoagaricus sp. SymC.cos]
MAPVALQHLIIKSGVSHILINEDNKELKNRLQKVREDPVVDITVSNIPSWVKLFSTEYSVEKPPPENYNLVSLCIVLHSSGSTALLELNPWTHRMVHTTLWQPWYGERDICGQVMSTPSIPMAGTAGVMQALFLASSGIIISGFQPTSPPTLPNPQNVWTNMIATESTYGFVLQPFFSVWSEDPDKVKTLASLKGVMFGGGPLPRAVGDKLAEKGVNISTFFGLSEGSLMNKVFPRKMGLNWEWFSFYSLVNPAF